jgi:hypothetical protein
MLEHAAGILEAETLVIKLEEQSMAATSNRTID